MYLLYAYNSYGSVLMHGFISWFAVLVYISGQQFSTRPHSADGRSHCFRATDIKVSLGGPEDKIRMFLEKENVPYQV